MIKKRDKIMKFIRIDETKLINIEEIQDVYSHLGDVYIDFKSGNSPMRIICETYTDRDAVIQNIQKAIEACNG